MSHSFLANCGYPFSAVASHPTLVLALASWFIALTSYGMSYIIITTDPIQIWASPHSQSRLEKDYFDSTFGPFYRSEQIFLRSKGLDKVLYTTHIWILTGVVLTSYRLNLISSLHFQISHPTADGVIEFGPVFNRKFLLSVFELQQKIEEVCTFLTYRYLPTSTGSYQIVFSRFPD